MFLIKLTMNLMKKVVMNIKISDINDFTKYLI